MTDLNNEVRELTDAALDDVVGGGLIDIGAGLVAAAATRVVGGGGPGGANDPSSVCGGHRFCIL